MALFSRRKKDSDDGDRSGKDRSGKESADASADDVSPEADVTPVEDVPQVSVSVSTFRGAGAPATPNPAPAASPMTPAVGGRRIVGNGEPPRR